MVQYRGRPASTNVEDNRAYFGTDSLDPDYYYEDRNADFVRDSIMSPYLSAPPQKFEQLTLEQLLELLAQEQRVRKAPAIGSMRTMGVLNP